MNRIISGCSDILIQAQSPNLAIIVVFDSPTQNVTYLSTNLADDTGVIFKFNRTDELVNSSLCHISSLEVYRGRQQAIGISNNGFSLSENGSIEVHTMN